jgi:tetratricopeptide (TPR) repeat protein
MTPLERASFLHQQGKLPEAESAYQTVLKVDREQFDALHGLAILRCQQGRYEEASGLFRRALRQKPQSPEAEYNLGTALEALRRLEEAAQHYRRAIELNPKAVPAHNNLGNVLKALGRHEDAIWHYWKALELRPDFAIAHNNLGNALQALGRREEAEAHYRQALALNANYAEAHNNLGNVLRLLGRGAESLNHYERALAADPGYVEAHNNFGNALKELGRFKEAAARQRRAIALDPRHGGAYLDLVEAERLAADDPLLGKMESLVADTGALAANARVPLHFALARAYDELGRHDDAFRHMRLANALKRREITHDEALMRERFAQVKAVVSAELLRQKAGSGDPATAPIFVLGMPRSGTTLVEQILASHPQVFGGGELDELSTLARTLGYPNGLGAADAQRLRALGASYVRRVRARAGPAPLWITDKMPANFTYVGLIHLILPNTRIIHTRRNPVDTCLSCFSKLFVGAGQSFSYDLAELGRYWREYDELMSHWRRVLPEGVIYELQYEDLVADTEAEARRLLAYCGIPWDDACLSFHATERPVRTASAAQVRRPIYQSAVARWRAYEGHLGPLLQELPPERVRDGR